MDEADKGFLRVEVDRLVRDHRENPVVLLKGAETNEVLPIWIGQAEALSIDLQLRGETFDRPLTHDLLKTTVESLGATVLKVAVTDLKDNTFFAKIYIQRGNEVLAIDARPSDSIALAVRTRSPIYVSKAVFETHKQALESRETETEKEKQDDSDDDLRRYLRDLDPGDF